MAEALTCRDFAVHLQSIFRVELPAQLDLELVEVSEMSDSKVEEFSILLAGPESPWLRQGTYSLAHPVMGQFDLFLVPLGPRHGRMIYQAVFCRWITTQP